jgi:hypothetical protein
VGETPPFASTREALGMLRTVLGYLGAGATEMAAQAQASDVSATIGHWIASGE